jgi:glycosyltransferase involved in cell wall biosynthesis
MEISFGIRLLFTSWNRPDVVIFVSPALFSTAFGILRSKLGRRRVALGILVQDLYSRGLVETSGETGLSARMLKRFESLVLRSADGVVAIHDRFRRYLVDVLDLEQASVVVIRNWTHLPAAPNEGQEDFRQRMGWEPGEFVVLHAGNMGKKQGLENVVNAARVAEQKGSTVRFVLMGDGHQRQTLETSGRGLAKLTFVDSLPDEDFQLALTAADALLVNELPGVREMSVPSKLTSYFNAGVPVIAASDNGSVTAAEVEASGGGIQVPAGDPLALVQAAESLSDDGAYASRLGLQGLRYRQDTLARATSISQYDDFVANLASSRR